MLFLSSHIFDVYFLGEAPPSGPPESFVDASQVGESHECLKVLQQGAFNSQKTDKGAHHLIDLGKENETELRRKSSFN